MNDKPAVVRVRGPRRTVESIHRLIREFHASKLRQTEFCIRNAVPLSTFQHYLKKHGARAESASAGEVWTRLLPVEIRRPLLQESRASLTVVLRKERKIEVGMGFDAATLAQLLVVLEKV
jgi:hypothetical protein